MWTHYCREEQEEIDVGDGEECNWCGLDAEAITIDGFDDAIMGYGEQYNKNPLVPFGLSDLHCITVRADPL